MTRLPGQQIVMLVQPVLGQLLVSVGAGMHEHAVPGGEQEGSPAVVEWKVYFFPLWRNWWEHPDLRSLVPEPCMSGFGTHY